MVVVAPLPAGCVCMYVLGQTRIFVAEPVFGSSAVRYVHVPAMGIMVPGYKILVGWGIGIESGNWYSYW